MATWNCWTASSTTTTVTVAFNWSTNTSCCWGARRLARETRLQDDRAAEERAERRAERLLLKLLSKAQRRMYRQSKKFHVIGSDGQRYEIDATKRLHNVFRLSDTGERVEELCIYATGDVPIADHLAAQKLLLEANEKRFRRIANKWNLAG